MHPQDRPDIHLPPQADHGDEHAQLRRLKLACIVEGTTLLLLLLIAVPLKHLCGWPTGVQVMGPVHGLAFVAYLWTVVQTVSGARWRRVEVVRLVLLAMLPLGGYLNAAWMSRAMRRPGTDRLA